MYRLLPFLVVSGALSVAAFADPVGGQVIDSAGEPVENASVSLVLAGATAKNTVTWISEGRIINAVRDNAQFDRSDFETLTDGDGQFEFPDPERGFVLVVTHEDGWSELTPSELEVSTEIMLRPWGRVHGVLHVAGEVATNRQFTLSNTSEFDVNGERADQRDWFRIRYMMTGTSQPDGSFAFERVMPGDYSGGVSHRSGRVHLHSVPIANRNHPVVVEERDHLELYPGLHGQSVMGKVTVPDDAEVDWSRIDVHVYPRDAYMDPPPGGFAICGMPYVRSNGYLRYFETEESKRFRVGLRGVEPDGSFIIDDLPAEFYEMYVILRDKSGDIVQSGKRAFEVRPHFEDKERPSLDLGELELGNETVREPIREFLQKHVPANRG